eukprot:gene4854-7488_t
MTEEYTMEEVARHKTTKDLWVAICGNVYHVPEKFLDDHPGGRDVIADMAGKDATVEWTDVKHSNVARRLMKPFFKGHVTGYSLPAEDTTDPAYVWPEQKLWEKNKAAARGGSQTVYFFLAVLVVVVAFFANDLQKLLGF